MKNYYEIAPSDDVTGAGDSAMLQRTIDRLARKKSALSEGAVLLSGEYYINAPLRIGGTLTSDDVAPVCLCGIGHARINYVGPQMSDYAIRYLGGDSAVISEGLRNLTICCNSRCRGVLVSTATYVGQVHNMHVRDSVEVGVDFIDCWAASFSNIHIERCQGYAVRFYRCNATHVQSLRINGSPATWPAADDTACVNCLGQPYRTTERCGLHIADTTALVIDNLICEGANYDAYPIIWLHGRNCLLNRPYFDANDVSDVMVTIRGSRGYGRRHTISGASMCETQCKAFVRLIGGTADNLIEQCSYAGLFSQAVVIQRGTTHTNNLIVQSSHDGVPDVVVEPVV